MKISQLFITGVLFTATCLAAPMSFVVSLSGPNESPANSSPGTGSAQVQIDPVANTLRVVMSFSGLVAGTAASHIHCCTPAPGSGTAVVATQVPTFSGFPLGDTSGSYSQTFDMTLLSSYNPAFVSANGGTAASAEAVLFAGIQNGTSYLNIHTTTFPAGEIRGFLQPVPEPGTFVLGGAALLGIALLRRR